ncbi:MAG: hypothetical protein OXG81_09055 [Acidobacteria bacterium]|nr:hypothetical protein [Acidobacteriota bacterium]
MRRLGWLTRIGLAFIVGTGAGASVTVGIWIGSVSSDRKRRTARTTSKNTSTGDSQTDRPQEDAAHPLVP